MVLKKSIPEKVFNVINHTLLVMLIIATIYPFLFVLMASLSSPLEVKISGGILIWPKGFNLSAYELVLQNKSIAVGYKNTFIYVTVGTFINTFMTIFAGYGLSRKWLYGRNLFMFFITFTMFFSGGLIPNYLLVKNILLINTRWALLIPNAVAAWNIIITRTFFLSIPDSLEESAKIDGANDLKILFRIMIPLSAPIIAVNVLFYAVAHWNSWFNALIYLKDRSLYPLQMFLRDILIQSEVQEMVDLISSNPVGENVKYAIIIVAAVPILCIYPFLQKYFVKGVMIGAIKG